LISNDGWSFSWKKVVSAVVIQAFVVVGSFGYLAWLDGRPKLDLPPYGSFESRRYRLIPVGIMGVVALFSVHLFYIGVVCGEKSIPIVRGVGLCR
jgi:hypothetical protein